MRLCIALATLFVFLCGAGAAALAADRTIPGRVEAYPTYCAIGIEATYRGDDNANGSAEFAYRRRGEMNWRSGVDLTSDRKRRTWCGSIFPGKEGEVYDIRVSFADPDGVETRDLTARARIRRIVDSTAGGRSYFVSPQGSDDDPGTQDAPLKTISAAAAKAGPGDTVHVAPGVYRESVKIEGRSGKPGRPIVFTAWGEGRPILDGSAELPRGGSRWKPHGKGIYFTSGDFTPLYVAEDGLRMYRYPSLAELEANIMSQDDPDTRRPWAVARAWYYDGEAKRLYVRTTAGDSPDGHTMNVVREAYGFQLEGSSHFVIEGFEIRHYGTAGIGLAGGSDANVVTDNIIHNSPRGVIIRGTDSDDNVLYRNEIYEQGLADFSWRAVKASGYGRQGISINAGRGNSVIENELHGWFDAVAAVTWKNPERVELNRDLDMVGNFIHDGGDDGLEPDGGGVNMRIWGNRITRMLTAISLAPIERGPVYVVRNVAYNSGWTMFKLGVGGCTSLAPTYVYHNSGYGTSQAINFPPDIPFSGKVFRNNAFCVTSSGLGHGRPGNTLDYNCYWVIERGGPVRMQWLGTEYPDLASLAQATGQEGHGLTADPLFVDGPSGDLRLRPNSPCIDEAVPLRGINDEFAGRAPDIGALESTSGKATESRK